MDREMKVKGRKSSCLSSVDDTAAAAVVVNQCSLACELVIAAGTFPRVCQSTV
jgi:hypothetical protein